MRTQVTLCARGLGTLKFRSNLHCCLKLLTLGQTNVEDDELDRIFLSSHK